LASGRAVGSGREPFAKYGCGGPIRQFDSFHRVVPEVVPHVEVFEIAFRLNVFTVNELCVHKKLGPKAQRKKMQENCVHYQRLVKNAEKIG
jgi:hypothetical protein